MCLQFRFFFPGNWCRPLIKMHIFILLNSYYRLLETRQQLIYPAVNHETFLPLDLVWLYLLDPHISKYFLRSTKIWHFYFLSSFWKNDNKDLKWRERKVRERSIQHRSTMIIVLASRNVFQKKLWDRFSEHIYMFLSDTVTCWAPVCSEQWHNLRTYVLLVDCEIFRAHPCSKICYIFFYHILGVFF